jgi:hypothetical protein
MVPNGIVRIVNDFNENFENSPEEWKVTGK